jgi:hypothetical protein
VQHGIGSRPQHRKRRRSSRLDRNAAESRSRRISGHRESSPCSIARRRETRIGTL